MEKKLLSAVFLIAAGEFIYTHTSLWSLGGILGWIGVIIGFATLLVWAAPYLIESWEHFMKGDENSDDKEDK